MVRRTCLSIWRSRAPAGHVPLSQETWVHSNIDNIKYDFVQTSGRYLCEMLRSYDLMYKPAVAICVKCWRHMTLCTNQWSQFVWNVEVIWPYVLTSGRYLCEMLRTYDLMYKPVVAICVKCWGHMTLCTNQWSQFVWNVEDIWLYLQTSGCYLCEMVKTLSLLELTLHSSFNIKDIPFVVQEIIEHQFSYHILLNWYPDHLQCRLHCKIC